MPLPIIVLAIIFGSMLLSLKFVLDYRRERDSALGTGRGRDEGSLGTGELKRLVRDAVEESIDPLVRRIDALERTLLGPAGPPRAALGPGRAELPPSTVESPVPTTEKTAEDA